jgi:hypothetical protein
MFNILIVVMITYRTAFFNDVMYSNHVPNREGALLYRDPEDALKIALIYQRYRKFDTSAYNQPNVTFYNIFAGQSMRIGRYKVPLSDELILCITDPLTFSEFKRYLTSFQPLKLFKSLFLQQKRKRQYVTSIKSDRFLSDSIEYLEYGRIATSLVLKNDNRVVKSIVVSSYPNQDMKYELIQPIKPLKRELLTLSASSTSNGSIAELPSDSSMNSSSFDLSTNSTGIDAQSIEAVNETSLVLSGSSNVSIELSQSENLDELSQLWMPLSQMNAQYFIENLVQVLLNYYKSLDPTSKSNTAKTVLLGSDGRLLSEIFLRSATRVISGQSAEAENDRSMRTILQPNDMLLTSSQALYTLESNPNIDLAIVFTAGMRAAGIRGSHGINVIVRDQQHPNQARYLSRGEWKMIIDQCKVIGKYQLRSLPLSVDLMKKSEGPIISLGLNWQVKRLDSSASELASILKHIPEKIMTKVKAYIQSKEPIIVVDCMHVPSTIQHVDVVLAAIGLDLASDGLHIEPRDDFTGITPEAIPEHALDMIKLSQEENAIDYGFVIGGDSRSCMVSLCTAHRTHDNPYLSSF